MSTAKAGTQYRAAPHSRPVLRLALLLALIATSSMLVFATPGKAQALSRPSQTLYTPPPSDPWPGSLYPRALQLQNSGASNGTMLATFEQYKSGTPVFPIYRSTDNGNTWTQISSVADTQNGWGMRWEPFLYELPTRIGKYPAGTILAAGDSVPSDRSGTKIDLYASTDHGLTWSFVSNIAIGGEAISTNGHTPIWEPFLMVDGSKLICYYSDQRDPNHGQKVVHQVSTDGLHWGPVVDDVATPTYSDRPGMPTVAKLPNGNYIMTYEYGGASEGNFAVYYKISSDPEAFGSVPGTVLRATDGTVPTSSPYIVWMPTGGPNGTLVVSAYSTGDLFLNTGAGAPNAWTRIASNTAPGYSRGMVPLPDGHSLEVFSAGLFGTGLNPVTYSTIDLGGGISDGATYTASNVNSKLMLAIAGGSTTNGSYATQQNTDNAADQQWRFALQPSGYFKIFNLASGKVLGVEHQSTADNAKIVQWDDNGTLDHEWAVAPNPAGGFTAINRLTGKYLEMPNASTNVGTIARQGDNTGSTSQRWNLTQTALPPLATGRYVLVNKNSGKYLEIPNASTTADTATDQWQNSACDCQLWSFQPQSGGAWTIKNAHSGLYLDVDNASTTPGAAVIQNTASGGNSQKWNLTKAGGGYYKLVNVGSDLVAGVAHSSFDNGAAVIQWNDAGIGDQLWQVVRVN
jgi:hypothetical protein